jgi:hypothetical protein
MVSSIVGDGKARVEFIFKNRMAREAMLMLDFLHDTEKEAFYALTKVLIGFVGDLIREGEIADDANCLHLMSALRSRLTTLHEYELLYRCQFVSTKLVAPYSELKTAAAFMEKDASELMTKSVTDDSNVLRDAFQLYERVLWLLLFVEMDLARRGQPSDTAARSIIRQVERRWRDSFKRVEDIHQNPILFLKNAEMICSAVGPSTSS